MVALSLNLQTDRLLLPIGKVGDGMGNLNYI